MRTFSIGIAIAAFAGTMTAIPADAQTIGAETAYGAPARSVAEAMPVERRYYSQDESTYAVLDEANEAWRVYDADDHRLLRAAPMGAFEPNEGNIVEVRTDRDLQLSAYGVQEEAVGQQRYYDPEGQTYAVFEPAESVWMLVDATTGEPIETLAEDAFDPDEAGYTEMRILPPPAVRVYNIPDPGVLERIDRAAGITEDRYDTADRQPGYTITVPGEAQVGMGIEGESILADPVPTSDNLQ